MTTREIMAELRVLIECVFLGTAIGLIAGTLAAGAQ